MNRKILLFLLTAIFFTPFFLSLSRVSNAGKFQVQQGVPIRVAADYIHAVIEAGRTFYSKNIVERLEKEGLLEASETWEQNDALPLPAQFLILSSQISNSHSIGMHYRLISLWPINPSNAPGSELEKAGLQDVINNPQQPFTWVVQRGETRWYQAIYPDLAVTESCVDCHNGHPKSPKRDFRAGDVMGGIVIDIPLRDDYAIPDDSRPLIPPEIVADYIHSVIDSDRTAYSRFVVDRLEKKKKIHSTENWKKEKALPLPAQFLANAGKLAQKNIPGLDFRLISLWPINFQNGPANEFERVGLELVSLHPVRPYIGQTQAGDALYFKSIFPDIAVATACVRCHNAHPKSPRRDFQMNDVMGGVVVSFPLSTLK